MDGTETGLRIAGAGVTESEFIAALYRMEGVLRVEPMDEDLVREVVETEDSICRVSGGMRLDNRGVHDCCAMEGRFVMFCDVRFTRPDEVTMEMVDDTGQTIGHDVPPGMREHFGRRNDVFWMSDCFVMYPARFGANDVRMVMLSSGLRVPGIPDWCTARLFYPSPSSAVLIESRYGVSDPMISAAILGVDGLGSAQFLGPM